MKEKPSLLKEGIQALAEKRAFTRLYDLRGHKVAMHKGAQLMGQEAL